MVAPTIIGLIILNIWPLIYTMYLSLCKLSGFGSAEFIGFRNYEKLFRDKEAIRSTLNTLQYMLYTVPGSVIIALILAVLLNTKIRGKSIYRTLYFIPVVSTPVAIAMVWRWIMNYDYGILNYAFSLLGIKGPNWIGDPKFAMITLAIVGIWNSVGYNMVILLAGLQQIPETFYEAAEIDGAGPFRRFRMITAPLVSPTLFFVVITSLMSTSQVFDQIFMMIGEKNPALPSVQSLVYIYYRYAFLESNKGYGSTISILLFMIIMAITLIQLALQKKWVHYEL